MTEHDKTSQHPEPEREQDDTLNALYQKIATETPPSALDDKIQNLARAQAKNNANLKESRINWFQWERIVSVAAVFVLSISIFWHVREEQSLEFSDEMSPTPFYTPNKLDVSDKHDTTIDPEIEESLDNSASTVRKKFTSLPESLSTEPNPPEPMTQKRTFSIMDKSRPEVKAKKALERQSTIERTAQESNDYENPKLHNLGGVTREQTQSAEELVSNIHHYLEIGEFDKARSLYQQLKRDYPTFVIPNEIQKQMEQKYKNNQMEH